MAGCAVRRRFLILKHCTAQIGGVAATNAGDTPARWLDGERPNVDD
jgi:hypothetical protein